ncbi:hypothetical protein Jab_2c14010 [Janthinobacterium sp. HH01]|uniref:hypothetical protein n=1 Tax=Janthinobacterium sp. HH01 TaxID=1198452 RepID=UPI0002AEBE2A|nr:hypothetical protein [Janthinobacterium sp. HH01]ELX09335.1 hypothetical protein Jab_2c14010 [Janthinobacterium sp. HH01]
MKTHYFSRLMGAAILAGLAAGAHAGECRLSSSVDKSADSVAENTEAGGHVSTHIVGDKTEAGKTQFDTAASFTSAFATWKSATTGKGGVPAPKTCGGAAKTQQDCVPAKAVKVKSATKCLAVDKSGMCTNSESITPGWVSFRYAHNKKGVWILNTAYPSANAKCS